MSSDQPKLRNPNLLLVKAQNNLKAEEKKTNLETDIVNLCYHKYQDISKHKNNRELVAYILDCVEECFKGDPHKSKIENQNDRIELIINVLIKLYPDFNTPEKIDDIKEAIKFIENRNLVNAVGCFRKLKKNLCGLVSKK